MPNGDDILGSQIRSFVDTHVRSLLTWDILVFFHRNPEAVLSMEALCGRLGRNVEELAPEIVRLCRDGIVGCGGGLISYEPDPELRATITAFAEASQERQHRLALIAAVLQKIGPT